MITLNFTFFVQLGLFLVFLWGTDRFILRPALRVMDQRDAARKKDEETAQVDDVASEDLENEYAGQLRIFQRRQHQRAEKARRAAQEKHAEDLIAHRKEGDIEVAEAHGAAQANVAGEREKYGSLTPDLANAIAERLGLKRGAQ